jgi:hypothetical protein
MEARDERRLLKLQAQLAAVKLLIVDKLGYVPLSQTGAELLFEIFSQRHERGSTFVTSNLPFEEWTTVFAGQRLTGALLDRLTHHVHILELNGESYRRGGTPLGSLRFWLSSLKKPMGTRARTGGGKPREGAMKRKFIMLAVSSSLVDLGPEIVRALLAGSQSNPR